MICSIQLTEPRRRGNCLKGCWANQSVIDHCRLGVVSDVRLPKGRCVPEPDVDNHPALVQAAVQVEVRANETWRQDVDSWRTSLPPASIDAVRFVMPE